MTSARKRTVAVLALGIAALGAVALPATAASAATSSETRVFAGVAGDRFTTEGIARATDRARAQATAGATTAGFTNCPSEWVSVFDNPPPGQGLVTVTVWLTCVR